MAAGRPYDAAVPRKRTDTVLARRVDGDGPGGRRPEQVLVEEPLELRVDGDLVATTMRTPGHDYELAAGWCRAEGLLGDRPPDGIRYCGTGSAVETAFNVVTVEPGAAATGRRPAPRLGTTTSACGVCGSEAVDELVDRLPPLPPSPPVTPEVLGSLADAVAPHQELFRATGGSHAAAAFDAAGDLLVVREDVGRHNAVDKVVGRLLLDGSLPATGHVLWVSGRASFEMVQKAWAAGFATLVSVSAPSSLAVSLARRAGLVLVGFARPGRLTVYAGDLTEPAGPTPGPVLRNDTQDVASAERNGEVGQVGGAGHG